jgi:hypothetical protein
MLVAQHHPSGERVEATRDLAADAYYCPLCASAVILKRGRVKVAHFAHAPGAACDWAGESLRHRLAKRVLADCFRALGYNVELEEPHPQVGRCVDVAVTMPTGHRIAVEVQDSKISVPEMKRRNRADLLSGFFGTVWVFTSNRAARLLAAREDHEIRVPDEIRWVMNRYGLGVFVIDENAGRMWRCHFGQVVRPGESHEWYTEDGELTGVDHPDRTLKSTKTVSRTETGFTLKASRARYDKPWSPDLTVVFAEESPASEAPTVP